MDFIAGMMDQPLGHSSGASSQNQSKPQQSQPIQKQHFRSDFPFWLWDITKEQHRKLYNDSNKKCCFVHAIGQPYKDGHPKPMFPYEQLIFKAMFEYKRVWIKKATGLGVTEFFIYFMLWLALVRPRKLENWLAGSHMVIVTGPREETAKEIIKRAKAKLEMAGIQNPNESKETEIKLGDIVIKAYPSFNASWRGLDKISFILADESDFWIESQQEEARAVAERYIGKSQAWIAMVSTPNKPGGLFYRIEQEEPCLYHRLKLDYRYGLGMIYTEQDIIEAKRSPQFGREYDGQYLGLVGTCFSEERIQGCLDAGHYDPDALNPYALRSIGIDCGWGSSPFGIVVSELSNNQVRILMAEEYIRPDYERMLDDVYHLIRQTNANKVVIDGSAADFVASVKGRIGERTDYLQQKKEYTAQGRNWDIAPEIKVLPIYFGKQNKTLLTHTKNLIDNGLMAINPKFEKLITFLRTANEEQGVLDKEKTSFHDVGDALMLSAYYFQIG